MRRHANKKDLNHNQVIEALQVLGIYSVDIDLSTGIDLLCYWGRVGWFTLEIKSKGGKETARQVRWRERCEHLGAPHLVYTEGQDLLAELTELAENNSPLSDRKRGSR